MAFASDWNVAEMEPLIGIYTALTRKGLDGKPEGGWVPDQTIDLETAIHAYTSDNITKSAYFPAVIEPRFCSAKFAYAPLIGFSNLIHQR